MLKAHRTSYNLAFKLKIVAKAEAVENNSEMASAPPLRQPSDQNNTRSASPRRFGAANSQVPQICNHIPSASRLFPIKNL